MTLSRRFALIALILAPATAFFAAEKQYGDPVAKWEAKIVAFEEKDQKAMPPKGAVVCAGSSSMVGWHPTIAKDLAPLTVVPRGFGGSNFNDLLHYADRVVIKYQPRAVLVYEGDNDIKSGISPAKIRDTFKSFVEKVHKALPECRIYVICIKPSPARWELWPKASEANKLLAEFCAADKRLTFIDVAPGMIGADGKPKEEIFKTDRLHMNAKGYEIWTGIVRPVLMKTEAGFEKTAKE